MKDLSRQRFEEDWKNAFDGAEVNPSDSIWSNIELELVKSEQGTMRKQIVFYKWLAAASVFLVVLLGGLFYFTGTEQTEQLASNKESVKEPSTRSAGDSEKSVESKKPGDSNSNQTIKQSATSSSSQNSVAHLEPKRKVEQALTPEVAILDESRKEILVDKNKEPQESETSERTMSSTFASLVEDVPAVVHGSIVIPRLGLPAMPASFMASSKKNITAEDTWASVGISTGNYNPGYGSGGGIFSKAASPQALYSNSNTGYSNPSGVGTARSAGFSVSKRVFERWVVQGGANYINQSIDYTSNYISSTTSNQAKAFVSEYADFSSQAVTITTPYQINSAIEVVSVPVQTGYLLIDRKIGWQLNTGVAADFFVKNTLSDQSGNASRFSQGAGDKSPYRTMSWAGLFGTELSYKVGRQYRISLTPGMRYSVNSVLKSTSGQISNPMVMDIGFRFRYIFK